MERIRSLDHLVESTEKLKTNPRLALTAAHDETSIKSVLDAAKANMVDPVFIGDKTKIKTICASSFIDISRIEVIDEPDDTEACYRAVEMYKKGQIDLIMKGLLNTSTLLRTVLDKDRGMPPKEVLSHVAVCFPPGYGKLLFITDAGVNISPNFQRKIGIIKNSVELARVLGVAKPKVAMLAAIEKVNLPAMPATLDAALLAKMSGRGAFKNVTIAGPFALDNAISKEAAKHKKIIQPVAGDADILCAPDIEAGNILYKTISIIGGLQFAGLAMGSRIPLVICSRSDSDKTKFYSIVLGAYYSYVTKQQNGRKP